VRNLPSLALETAKHAVLSLMRLVSPDDSQERCDQLLLTVVDPKMILHAGLKARPAAADNAMVGLDYGEGPGQLRAMHREVGLKALC